MTASRRILVLGRLGQVATELSAAPLPPGWSLVCLGRGELDIRDEPAVRRTVRALSPDLVVNAAAVTAVDEAERDPEPAWAVNRDGAAAAAAACSDIGAPLVHLSTDYVFNGLLDRPYRPGDAVSPLSVYGASKAAGEDAVRRRHDAHVIIRTSWIFSPHGRNFLTSMLGLAGKRSKVEVVADRTGCPTSAADVAACVLGVAAHLLDGRSLPFGTHHFCNAGATSWYGFAEGIFALAARRGLDVPRLVPIPGSAWPAPARRPEHSVLDTAALPEAFGIVPRPWQEALEAAMDDMRHGARWAAA